VADDSKLLERRKYLFEAAQDKRIDSENALLQFVQDKNIARKNYDVNPFFAQWSGLVKKYAADRTPTCFAIHPEGNVRKYVGDEEIWNGLRQSKAHLRK